MLSERGRRALLGMLENATAAQDFVQGLTFEAFTTHRRTLYAVIHCLEIISEASRRVDVATVDRHPMSPGGRWPMPATFTAIATITFQPTWSGGRSLTAGRT